VRQDDEIHLHVLDRREVGHRVVAELFGVEPRIDEDVEAADLDVGGVGSDAAETIQVDKFHILREVELGLAVVGFFRNLHLKRRDTDMDGIAGAVNAMKGAFGPAAAVRCVVAVVGK